MALTTGTRLGSYEIVSLLGAGGMGEVYRARDPRVGRDVALKVSAEQFSERFEREIHAVAALNHPNICSLYDVGPNYLVMELVEGPTLAERLVRASGRSPELDEVLNIARQIADALEAAHEKGIVHRDLKPGNIKIKPDGTVKVLDFGLAKVGGTPAVSSDNSPTLSVAATQQGVILGTAAYMSPEQAKGKTVDKRADIWSFGVVLYEMLTGKQLFTGETVSDILAAVLTKEPDWEKVPAKVRPLLRRCLEKDPKKRLRDIGDAYALIESAPESVPVKRAWLAWSLVTVFIITTLALSLLYFREKAPATTESIRFQIIPPTSLDWGSSFAVSPDGHHLAFAAAGSDGVVRLWVRTLDSLEARSLPGTESNHIVPFFWSPDGRFIAFDAGGKLKKIDIIGGPAQTICDALEGAFGGSWNRDGVIIFGAYGSGGGLNRVSAAGGAPSPLAKLDPARHVTGQYFPTFLPDGRHFLYFQNSDIQENRGVYIGSLDLKPEEQGSKQLLAAASAAVYVPSQDSGVGQFLFLREQTLVSQRFDAKLLELVGEPIPVAEKVGSIGSYGFFSASTNGVLVYRSGGVENSTRAMWFDRQGKSLGAAGEPAVHLGVALSPDGARAAVSMGIIHQTIASLDIWLLDFARGTNTRFTFGQGLNRLPVWSQDGSHIIFASNRDGAYNLYQKMSSGVKDEELLLKSSESKYPTSWSSDGRFLSYTAVDPKTKDDLWVLPLEGDRKPMPFLRTEFNELDGHFSPDMRWVAYTSDESGSNEIYVRGFSKDSGASSEQGGKWQVSVGGGTGPRWRRDGKELYYQAPDGKVMVVEIRAGTVFQSGTPKPLFQAPPAGFSTLAIPLTQWDVTSDGNRFLFPTVVPEATSGPFTVVLNWQAELKK